MNRKIYYWKLRGSEMQLGERTLIMGVLNVTPDSFSDGGRFNDPDRAYARALELEEQGADIIDIGAESTKPGSERISLDEEWQRLVPVLKRLRGNLRVPLSLDTYKSEIAERALEYGVEIFNDPTGLTYDPNLAKVAAQAKAGLVLNHMRGEPGTWAKLPPMQDPIGTIARELEATVNRARGAGVERAHIVVDPGLGFGKRKEQNAAILAHLKQFAGLDYPILVGPSRKSFLAQSSAIDTSYATAAAVAVCVVNGAHIVRVHDVREMQSVVQVAEEIARAGVVEPIQRAEERPSMKPRFKSGPDLEADRPRPTRAPILKPAPEKTIAAAAHAEHPIEPRMEPKMQPRMEPRVEHSPEPRREPRPQERPFTRDADRDKRGGFRPPVSRRPADRPEFPPRGRDFRPGQGERFRPAAPKRPFGRNDDRREGRPPRPMDREQSRAPYSKPGRSGPAKSGPPKSGPPTSGPPRSGPREDRFKSSGPKRTFDRGGDSRQDRPASRPPRSSGPPKRPFRKRP